MLVSTIALFISLGGAGYAASWLPAGSVNSAALQNDSVRYRKDRARRGGESPRQPRSAPSPRKREMRGRQCHWRRRLGRQADLQPRAPGGVQDHRTATVPGPATSVASLTLPAGSSYLAFANLTVTVKSTSAEDVNVTCSLTLGANTQTRRRARDDRCRRLEP
ncbi:MAG: hypothetical protein ACR2GZ_00905 [Solirubrobacteraceae bacterium]